MPSRTDVPGASGSSARPGNQSLVGTPFWPRYSLQGAAGCPQSSSGGSMPSSHPCGLCQALSEGTWPHCLLPWGRGGAPRTHEALRVPKPPGSPMPSTWACRPWAGVFILVPQAPSPRLLGPPMTGASRPVSCPHPPQPPSACPREAGPHCSQTILQARPGAALGCTGACGQEGPPGEVGAASWGYWGGPDGPGRCQTQSLFCRWSGLIYLFFLAALCGLWDLSSFTRN